MDVAKFHAMRAHVMCSLDFKFLCSAYANYVWSVAAPAQPPRERSEALQLKLFHGYATFLALMIVHDENNTCGSRCNMRPSPLVERMWFAHMLCTQHYRDDCELLLGKPGAFLHHSVIGGCGCDGNPYTKTYDLLYGVCGCASMLLADRAVWPLPEHYKVDKSLIPQPVPSKPLGRGIGRSPLAFWHTDGSFEPLAFNEDTTLDEVFLIYAQRKGLQVETLRFTLNSDEYSYDSKKTVHDACLWHSSRPIFEVLPRVCTYIFEHTCEDVEPVLVHTPDGMTTLVDLFNHYARTQGKDPAEFLYLVGPHTFNHDAAASLFRFSLTAHHYGGVVKVFEPQRINTV
jgi:hypothetical protein